MKNAIKRAAKALALILCLCLTAGAAPAKADALDMVNLLSPWIEGDEAQLSVSYEIKNLLPYNDSTLTLLNNVLKHITVEGRVSGNDTSMGISVDGDSLFSGSLYVNRMIELEVEHNLLGCHGAKLNEIRTVVSHPQALEQCAEFIRSHGWQTLSYSNTALAAQYVASQNDPTVAAIASEETAELYGLELLSKGINASRINTTRFAVFSRALHLPAADSRTGNEHFILVFTTKNEAGALAQPLNIIGAHDFNMRNLRSRPMKNLIWNYYFFVEAEGNISSVSGQNMLRELSAVCARLKLVGTYSGVKA